MKDNEAVTLTVEQAIDCLRDGDEVHVIINGELGNLGADWQRQSIIAMFQAAEKIEIGGTMCRRSGHGIVVFPKGAKYQSDLYFVECNDDKLAAYDRAARGDGQCG